eukprot:XP_011682043.1 PREDICTED: uncharacterized protein LOC105446665 [Strongylocentrotus purpuratus]
MASKFPAQRDGKVKLRTRKGHNMTWSCDIHRKPIKRYCKEHKIPVCHPCATKEHYHKPCKLDDIEDVILERRRKLDDKQLEIEEMKKQLKTLSSKLESTATSASKHLQSVNDELKVAFEDKIQSVKDKEKRSICLINEEADEEIQIIYEKEEADEEMQIINEKRERRIISCHEEAEQQQLIFKESQAKVESETKAISEAVSNKMKYLKTKNLHSSSIVDNIGAKIKRIKQEDKTLVNETPQVIATLEDNAIVHQDVMDCLCRIQREVQRVKFVEGEVGGEHYGRIDGYIGKWELVKSIHIASTVNQPVVCGSISDDEICVLDETNNATYVTNISTEHTQTVTEGGSNMYITSCASIDSNVIVCGVWRKDFTCDSLDRCIALCDRHWMMIRNISLPRNNPKKRKYNDVHVDVDMEGMILAAPYDQPNIYVIKPAGGKMEKTITMQSKVVMGEIQALSLGDIVVNTGCVEYTVISRSGEVKVVIHSDEWESSQCHVDKLTDTLYITYWDTERNIYAVDQVSCDGIIEARRIVEYEASYRCAYISPCLVTLSGNLVTCNGKSLLVYKKSFIV